MTLSPTVWAQIRDGLPPTPPSVDRVLDDDAVLLGADGVRRARAHLAADVLGAGPLEPLLQDPQVTDVLVNGSAGVWVDRGAGLLRTHCPVGDDQAVRRLAVRLAGLCGRRLDDTAPYVDGLLPGGARLHAVLPPLAVDGPYICVRVPRRQAPSLADLHRWGSFSTPWLRVLRDMVGRRCAFVVSGGTGSGKTTLLGALLAEVDPGERIVLVEDVRELMVRHPHVVRPQSRAPNVEGRGEITMTDLVRQSLRMRPDRLVVGEVRGGEVRELLTALNTGHEGGCGTMHANTSSDVVARFEALGALADLSPAAVHGQLRSAVRVVVHVRRLAPAVSGAVPPSGGGAESRGEAEQVGRSPRTTGVGRVVQTIGVVQSRDDGRVGVVPALERAHDGSMSPGPGWPALAMLLGRETEDPVGDPA